MTLSFGQICSCGQGYNSTRHMTKTEKLEATRTSKLHGSMCLSDCLSGERRGFVGCRILPTPAWTAVPNFVPSVTQPPKSVSEIIVYELNTEFQDKCCPSHHLKLCLTFSSIPLSFLVSKNQSFLPKM